METALVINSVRHLPDKGGFFYGDSSIGPVVGTAEFVSTGVKMYVTGEWKKHSMYGKQFQVKSFRYATPVDSLKALFGSGFLKGIKAGKATNVVETLGDKKDVYVSTPAHDHIVCRIDSHSRMGEGQQAQLHLDMERVHVFEPGETGMNISLDGDRASAN